MSSPTYRVQAFDLLTQRSLCWDLQATIGTFSRGLNDAGGGMTATISLRGPLDLSQVLQERKTAIWVWRNEVPVWGGILWVVDPDIVGETVSITCQGFMSYLSHVRLLSDQTFTNKEQLDIARALIDYTQGQPNALLTYGALSASANDTGGSNLGIQYGSDVSGVLRTRAPADGYAGYQAPNVMDLLTNLAGVINGFQWFEDVQWSPGSTLMPTPYVYWGFPQFTRSLPLRLRYPGANVVSYDFSKDGTTSVNRYIALGATNTTNNSVLRAVRNNLAEQAAGYPALMGDSGSNYNDVTNNATLDQHAVEDLATVAGSTVAFSVVARGDIFGSFSVGDTLQTSFESAWHRTPFEGPLQCVQWELAPASSSQDETLTLSMAPVRSI